jgi:hypothetical protein
VGSFVIPEEPKGPFCRSCGMPIEPPIDSETGHAGRASHFCRFCVEGRTFTDVAVALDRPEVAAKSPTQKGRHVIARLKSWWSGSQSRVR